jgi:hypothetical protein
MPNNVFVTYKFSDSNVCSPEGASDINNKKYTVRDYVDYLEKVIKETNWAYYKGEELQPTVQGISQEHIRKRLAPNIQESNITVCFISPGMKNYHLKEKYQWMPWEIALSLERPNAMLGIVLPDKNGSYEYFLKGEICRTGRVFGILRRNINNKKDGLPRSYDTGNSKYHKSLSYIKIVRWNEFIEKHQEYMEEAQETQKQANTYRIRTRKYNFN